MESRVIIVFKFILLFLLYSLESISQNVPHNLSYQFVAMKDKVLLKEKKISVRISICHLIKGVEQTVYLEDHPSVETDKNAMVHLKIGDGVKGSGFSNLKLFNLNWANTVYYIKSYIDWSGKNFYDDKSFLIKYELMSIPYALYAANSPKINVIDNLNTRNISSALSANQGKVLKSYIDTKLSVVDIADNLTTDNNKMVLSPTQGKKFVETYGITKRWKNGENYSIADVVLHNGNLFSLKTALNNYEKATSPESLPTKWSNIFTFYKTNPNIIMNWDNSLNKGLTNITKTAIDNIIFGLNSAKKITTGSENIVIGNESISQVTTASRNISIGNKALNSNSTGNDNISMGDNSLKSSNNSKNIAIGISALSENITGVENISIGYNAGSYHGNFASASANTGSKKSIYIGQEVTSSSATADNEIVIGYRAEGKGNNTVVIGNSSITNTYIPNGALELTNGDLDIKSGNINLARNANISGQLSTSNFYTQWDNSRTYSKNSIVIKEGILYKSLKNANTNKSPISEKAYWEAISGNRLVNLIKTKTLDNIITLWSGKNSNGKSGGSGIGNTFLGIGSGNSIESGENNLAIGYDALNSNNIGSNNVAIGNNSLGGITSSSLSEEISNNVAIGDNSGYYSSDPGIKNTKASKSIYLGADTKSKGEKNEIVVGYGAIGKGDNTIVLGNSHIKNTYAKGSFSLENGDFNMHDGDSNISIGNVELFDGNANISGELSTNKFYTKFNNMRYHENDIVIGNGILYKSLKNSNSDNISNTTSWQCINAGLIKIDDNLITRWSGVNSNGTSAGTGNKNIFLGIKSGNLNTTGSGNIAFGYESLINNTQGSNNIAIGNNVLTYSESGSNNIGIGNMSLHNNVSGHYNIAIGRIPIFHNEEGLGNIGIGDEAFMGSLKGNYNVAIGYRSINYDSINGVYNTVAIGKNAGNLRGGGTWLLDIKKSIYLGVNTASSTDVENEIVIGYDAKGKGSNTVVLGNSTIKETFLNGRVFLNKNASNTFNEGYGLLNINGYYGKYSINISSYFGKGSKGLNSTFSENKISIYANKSILTDERFIAISDRRMKNIIGVSDKNRDLKNLLEIEITDYTLVDSIEKGNKFFKKVIAQQIENTIPEIIDISRGIVPDVYELAKSVRASSLGSIITTEKKHSFSNGDRVKVIIENTGDKIIIVKEVIDSNTFLTEDVIDSKNMVFIYGKEVEDLRSVDYDGLTTLNISATQAVYQNMKDNKNLLKQELYDVEKENAILKKSLKSLYNRNDLLKQNLETLKKDIHNSNMQLELLLEEIKFIENR
ncbi:hypothetical protein [Ichthyobacterium seriolicida]|uniref:Peptidase S74 domain-containing protein n=1 Tax=Ichthyobacterium seriolicida TaxID=242600 RepID=A0A1J1EAZ9_9FLAO|nr:hypothetical protein [Ichthyobacterium seriolicida]BAV94696.1 hypothetical protein JBKA6_0683 [Ichthyobacterium seriolicida]